MAKTIKIHDPNNGATNLFAKLLATENISVRHDASAPTAMFDVKGRTLTLPVWQASKTLYDMLVGHEVAHALFTPAVTTDKQFMDDMLRVHSNVHVAKQYVNVVEDARIERRIKSKFPGLRNDFRTGYAEMRDKDFFGLGDDDPNTLSLIDRLNIKFKLGIHTGMEVDFASEEMPFVTRMEDTDTWDDVLTLAHDLAKWSEEHDEKKDQQQSEDDDADAEVAGSGGDEDGEVSSNFGGGESEEGEDGKSSSPTNSGDEDNDVDPEGDANNDGGDAGEDLGGPAESTTQQSQDQAMDQMRANAQYNSTGAKRYLTVGKIIKDNIVVSIDDIDSYLAKKIGMSPESFAHHTDQDENAEFLRTARTVVSNMAKQFEMKKAADLNKRVSVARTGVLDVMRLTRYKFDDDLFLRNTIIPNGKNHGMIMLVDWSSSMSSVIKDTLRQVVVLSMFCKKLNIPFDVYAFSSQLHPFKGYEADNDDNMWRTRKPVEGFALTEDFDPAKHIEMRDFCLLHLLSSNAKKNNWLKALNNVMTLSQWRPGVLGLGSTPLDDALLVMPQIIGQFQRTNKAQVMNLIVLTDGQTTGSPLRGNTTIVAKNGIHCTPGNARWDSTSACLRYVHNETGCNMLGLFVCEARAAGMHSIGWKDRDAAVKGLKENNYFQNPVDGYHAHFLVKSTEITSGDIFAGLNADASPTKIRNTFIKQLGDRKKSFSYTGRFVDMICAIQGGL